MSRGMLLLPLMPRPRDVQNVRVDKKRIGSARRKQHGKMIGNMMQTEMVRFARHYRLSPGESLICLYTGIMSNEPI